MSFQHSLVTYFNQKYPECVGLSFNNVIWWHKKNRKINSSLHPAPDHEKRTKFSPTSECCRRGWECFARTFSLIPFAKAQGNSMNFTESFAFSNNIIVVTSEARECFASRFSHASRLLATVLSRFRLGGLFTTGKIKRRNKNSTFLVLSELRVRKKISFVISVGARKKQTTSCYRDSLFLLWFCSRLSLIRASVFFFF